MTPTRITLSGSLEGRRPSRPVHQIFIRRWIARDEEALPIVSCDARIFDAHTALDPYGRVVCDLRIRGRSLNLHMLRSGWAFPAMYESIPPRIRRVLLAASTEARKSRRGAWQYFTHNTDAFSPIYTRETAPILWPKLFRTMCQWHVMKRAHLTTESFPNWLRTTESPLANVVQIDPSEVLLAG